MAVESRSQDAFGAEERGMRRYRGDGGMKDRMLRTRPSSKLRQNFVEIQQSKDFRPRTSRLDRIFIPPSPLHPLIPLVFSHQSSDPTIRVAQPRIVGALRVAPSAESAHPARLRETRRPDGAGHLSPGQLRPRLETTHIRPASTRTPAGGCAGRPQFPE